MRIFVAILVVLALITFYFIGWKLNKKQKLPDELNDSVKTCEKCGHTGCCSNPEQGGEENE